MLKIYIDAAFQSKTRTAGLAIIINDDGQQIPYKIRIEDVYDNHQAEFFALDQVLKLLEVNEQLDETLFIHSDSKIVVQSVQKSYVKEEHYREILKRILMRLEKAPLAFIKWIPEKENRGADQLAKQALHQQGKLMSWIE